MKALPVLVVLLWVGLTDGVQLSPPYFVISQGKPIQATSTCGESPDGEAFRETYCGLRTPQGVAGAQLCGYCDKDVEKSSHPAQNAVDGSSSSSWQSPPLSRGSQFEQVNLTIDLGQEFEVSYITVKMENTPLPREWALEKSLDNGNTYQPLKYGQSRIIPLAGGMIYVNLRGRQTLATHVRLRLLKMNVLHGHQKAVQEEDPSVLRRYFYAVQEIQVGGRCACNGNADLCLPSPQEKNRMICECEKNTCGSNCQECCPGYENYPNCIPGMENKRNSEDGIKNGKLESFPFMERSFTRTRNSFRTTSV